ncbi:hypothetical protein THRCLA_21790 [Thraustotheca clavata]|uniref:Copper homeostasis protein cutC homolog n=1 Tax=Thraustotheca clavata TaxID=74557 RepID=A0A1V9ZP62_9STRA|nr:hypothetical protein THRCLA_21790 [Thraustotheca clavata]
MISITWKRTTSALKRFQRGLSTKTSYYDSQSGQHVEYTNAIQIHALGDENSPTIEGLASLTIPSAIKMHELLPKNILVSSEDTSHGFNIALDVSCTADRATWDAIIAKSAKAVELKKQVKITLLDALDASPYDVQLLGSLLADAGVNILTLSTGISTDTDALEEVYEALTWSDVVGLPMKQRVGLRTAPEEAQELLEFAATTLEIKHYDVCFKGNLAPTPAELTKLFSLWNVQHSIKF